MSVVVPRSVVRRWLGMLVLLASLATLSYSNSFFSPFHFDDERSIVENASIKQLSRSLMNVSESRYVGWVSFAVNYSLGRLNVVGYHLTNLLIHITNGLLIYTLVTLLYRTPGGLASRSTGPPQADRQGFDQGHGVALITALLFVTHPIQTQAVTYIVQRFASLATLLYLLAIICYVQWRLADQARRTRYGWYGGALVSTILAMKSKEISFTLPFMLLLVEGVFFRPNTWKRWLPLIPFLGTLAIIPLSLPGDFGETHAGFARQTMALSRLSYLYTQCRVIVTYLRLLLVPIHQNLDYDYPIYHTLLAPPVILSALLILSLLGSALYLLVASPRWRLVGFGIVWFFLTLSVESSIIPIADVIFEHRVYLPSVGFLLAGSVLVMGRQDRLHLAPTIIMGVVIALCSVATYQRNLVWKDEVTLWSHVVAESPRKARAHESLGYAYAQQGRLDQAITEYLTAIRLDPDSHEAHLDLASALAQQGRLDEAISELMTVIRLKPNSAKAHNNLGNAYLQQRQLDKATSEFLTALRLDPNSERPHNNLGNVYAQQGKLDEAISEFLTAVRLNPDSPNAYDNLGFVYTQQGRLDQATNEYLTAVRLNPNSFRAHVHLGYSYARQGQLDRAIQEYLTALALNPDSPEAHNNLGMIYQLKGLSTQAREEFQTVLRLRPNFEPARQALKALDAQ